MGFWETAVASAGKYANNMHLAPDRQLHQHITEFLQAGRSSWRRTGQHCQSTGGIISELGNGRLSSSRPPDATNNTQKRRHAAVVRPVSELHTHPFNGPFSGTTRVSRYQKGKTNLDFTEARDSQWQWHQLGHMQACTSLQTHNHISTPPLSFYRPDALPAAQPTASKP